MFVFFRLLQPRIVSADVALRPALNVSTVTSEMIVAKVREVASAVTGDEALEVETPLMEACEVRGMRYFQRCPDGFWNGLLLVAWNLWRSWWRGGGSGFAGMCVGLWGPVWGVFLSFWFFLVRIRRIWHGKLSGHRLEWPVLELFSCARSWARWRLLQTARQLMIFFFGVVKGKGYTMCIQFCVAWRKRDHK